MSAAVEGPPYASLGEPITGPRALGEDWSRLWHLTYNIARNEFKLRFFGSVLGYFWQLVRPLLLFSVLYVFFVKLGRIGNLAGPSNHFYGAQLLGSIVLFTFFAEATMGAVRSVVDRENLVRKIQFPRIVIPLSIVLVSLFNLTLNLVVVFVFALIEGVRPMLTWLELPLIVALLAVLSTGLAMLLSSLFVYFRDIQPIWEVVSQILFYASPVIISLTTVQMHLHGSAALFRLYALSPLTTVLQQFRHAIITHGTLSAGQALGSTAALLGPIGISVAVFVLGFVVFNRTAPQVAENI
ncbi:MAG: ABC transporter permease [Solirubrobacteraceae bacterium]